MSHAPGTHEAVRRLLGWRDRNARCLDVAAGDAPFSFDLTALATWWDREKGGPDLNSTSWQPDGEMPWDVVVAIEVLEHVENPWAFWRSLRTLLHARSVAIITTPNLYSALSRDRIGAGHHAPWFAPGDETVHGHISPILPHLMDEQARRAGFVVTGEDFSDMALVRALRVEVVRTTCVRTT